MLGAFRRSAVSHALRASARAVPARSTPQRFQFLSSPDSASPHAARSLFHSTSIKFDAIANAAVQNDIQESDQEQPGLSGQFQELADKNLVEKSLIDNITGKMKIETMTDVQRLTIPVSVGGEDVLAQAKTGTGKTIAFLIPVLQNLLRDPTLKLSSFHRGRPTAAIDIRAIIVSPTRELAEQIAVEATRVAGGSGIVVQTAVGGTQKKAKLLQLQSEGCHILVATPGRLRDLLSDPYANVQAPKLSTLVLDEADRLLDDGFAPELMEIQQLLPDPTKVPRQTLMFSATVAPEVMGMVRQTMKPKFSFIKTVNDNEVPTHISVPQKQVILQGYENILPALFQMAKRAHENRRALERPFKAIVYFNSTKEVKAAFETFENLLNEPEDRRSGHPLDRMFLGEIHSRLTQQQRTRVSTWFRRCTSGLLFSSDVTARGMDFPDVTHVIQIGVPRGRADYVHRLGRTARANKTGEGWVFLHPAEKRAFNRLCHDIPINVDNTSLSAAQLDLTNPASLEYADPELVQIVRQVQHAAQRVSPKVRSEACSTHMIYVRGVFANKQQIASAMNDYAIHGFKLDSPPAFSPGLALKLGIRAQDGFVIRSPSVRDGEFGGQRRGGFGGGREEDFPRGGAPGFRNRGTKSSFDTWSRRRERIDYF
ncbi:P-loop containing nucleoside triphosphate hydrolase protein [Aspergillus lucknowensis]|uniref:ATP-dependent RNA helicase n=1 Tax=Aspergillus lucknowensis TaxID=176173 RepID=A0ABR4M5Q7_9EURO